MSYFTVCIPKIDSELVDDLSEMAFQAGASGVEEPLQFFQEFEDYQPQIIESPTTRVLIYFETPPSQSFIEDIQKKFEISAELKEEADRDWLEEWKKGFHSFRLIDDVWVVPSWENPPTEAKVPLRIDPGMAFGTGTHETTQLVSRLLEEQLKKERPQSFLDVGTGTGILSIYLAKRGVPGGVATEIDPQARVVARENLSANDLTAAEVNVLEYQVERLNKRFDWVIANIIDGVLIQIKDDLVRCCAGELFLSGILDERREHFEREFIAKVPFQVVSQVQQGPWLGYHLKRVE